MDTIKALRKELEELHEDDHLGMNYLQLLSRVDGVVINWFVRFFGTCYQQELKKSGCRFKKSTSSKTVALCGLCCVLYPALISVVICLFVEQLRKR